jgi:hypothetical protein
MLGKIRKGDEKKAGSNRPGSDLTYFRVDSDIDGINEKFTRVYGKEPDQLDCLLPFASVEQVFPAWMEEWGKSSIVTRCDEETRVLYEEKGKIIATRPLPCKKLIEGADGNFGTCECKQVGRLHVVLPKLGEMGYFEVETHSKWDIIGLTEQLLAVETAAGSLTGIPFLLERGPRELSYPLPDGKRGRKTFNLLSIRVHPDRAAKVLQVIETRAFQQFTGEPSRPELPSSGQQKALPASNGNEWASSKKDGIQWAVKQGMSLSEATLIADRCTTKREYFDTVNSLLKDRVNFTEAEIVGNEINPQVSAEIDAMIEDRPLLETVPADEDEGF